jgi:shikimate dehydrogenase
MFGGLTQCDIQYERAESTPETFTTTINDWQQSGASGCNVTMPFKGLAFDLCDVLSQSATDARAVNTIRFNANGQRYGYNTDGSGLLADLTINQAFSISDTRVLLIGAGGAARGVLGPLIAQTPQSITIANRSVDKAQALCASFADKNCDLRARGYDDLMPDDRFDLVINATSLSLQKALPPLPSPLFAQNALSYDMTYSNEPTVFMQWSQQHGANIICDGLGMLVEQAADAFEIWEGVRPETQSVYALLKAQL